MQLMESATPLVPYRGQDSNYDDLMNVPIRRFSRFEDLEFSTTEPSRYLILDSRYSLPVDLLFYPRSTDRLIVGFHGAENRATSDFPKFQFVRSFLSRKESLLFISDSTLLQGQKINIGWSAGNEQTPLADLLSSAVRSAGEALSVKETLLVGHSAGGFSAIKVGSQVPNSRAISVNGQSVVGRYHPWTVANLHKYAFPECGTQAEMLERYPDRLDLRTVLESRIDSSSFTYFGNPNDTASFGPLPHFPLLAEAFSLDSHGGVTDRGDAFVPATWGEDGGRHALPGTILPFVELVLGEKPSREIIHTVSPVWDRRACQVLTEKADQEPITRIPTWQDYMELRVKGQETPMPWYLHDKLKCYRWCEANGIPTATVVREFDTPAAIDLTGLSGEFVLKPTLQSSMKGVMVLTPKGDAYHDSLRNRDLSLHEIIEEQERLFNETKAAGKKIIVEEKIVDADGFDIPRDFKAYAFGGEIALILEVDRNSGRNIVAWYDPEFKPILDDRVGYSPKYSAHQEGKTPNKADKMVQVAKLASSLVESPFARIDLYSSTAGVIVGEITLVPGGLYYGNHYFLSEEQQQVMGRLWENALVKLGRTHQILEGSPLYNSVATEFDRYTDEELFDVGMYRCKCGAAVYPQGDNAPHC